MTKWVTSPSESDGTVKVKVCSLPAVPSSALIGLTVGAAFGIVVENVRVLAVKSMYRRKVKGGIMGNFHDQNRRLGTLGTFLLSLRNKILGGSGHTILIRIAMHNRLLGEIAVGWWRGCLPFHCG